MTSHLAQVGAGIQPATGERNPGPHPHVSVIVPIFNVERYITECLESLARQTMPDLQVVMVDDGSTDSSASIASAFAASDSRFTLVRQPNRGLGAARNTGTRHAVGNYIAFVDSDDIVMPRAYELLAGSLDRTGSDLATGNFYRLTTSGTRQAGMVFTAFNANRPRTHVSKHPALLNDRTAWNKLFRRRFWEGHKLSWPEGVLYEDIPVTLPAHVLAHAVDVIRDPVYLWRARVGDASSITQRRIAPRAIRDRTAAVDGVSRFLAARGEKQLKRLYDRSVAAQDLRYFLSQLDEADQPFQLLFIELANDFFDRADSDVFERLPSLQRLEWFLVRRRLLAELLEVLRFERSGEANVTSFVRQGRRAFYADYPFRGDPDVAVPDSVYRLRTDELPMPARITDIWWEGDALILSGFAYIVSLPVDRADSGRLRITLEEVGHADRVVRLTTQPVLRPDVTTASGRGINSDWSGFQAAVPLAKLRHGGRFRTGIWRLRVERRSQNVTRRRWLSVTEPGRASRPEVRTVNRTRFVPTTPAGGFQLEVSAENAVVDSAELEGDVVQLVGTLAGRSFEPETAYLRAAREDGRGAATLSVTAYGPASAEPTRFVSRIDLAALRRAGTVSSDVHGAGLLWQLYLQPSEHGGPAPLVVASELSHVAVTAGGRETRLIVSRTGRLQVTDRPVPLALEQIVGTAEGFELSGRYAEFTGRPLELILAARQFLAAHVVPVTRDGDRFTARLSVEAVKTAAGSTVPLAPGSWDVHGRLVGSPLEAAPLQIALDPSVLASLPVRMLHQPAGPSLAEVGDVLRVTVPEELDPPDRGRAGRARLRCAARRQLRESLLDQVLVDPYGPGRYADDARAVYDELRSRDPRLGTVWTVKRGRAAAPDGVREVSRGSAAWYEAVARSRYVVTGGLVGLGGLGSRDDQVIVQTWHGVAVRPVGLDDERAPLRGGQGWARRLRAEAARWNLVPAAGPAHARQLRRAFDLDQRVRETGLPRHDVLANPGRADERTARAATARLALGISADRRVVLWAPSYRPRSAGDATQFHLDLGADPMRLADGLGAEHALVVRPHPSVVDTLVGADGSAVVDASWYADTTDLLLAADVLVTDDSSLLWDRVLTGGPMVFWMPGAAARDELPGRRYLATGNLPGPVISEEDDLVAAILSAPDSRPGPSYRDLQAALAPLADGGAAARVVNLMLALGESS